MADLFGGAALGAAFGELLNGILGVGEKTIAFKPTLELLKRTLDSLNPVIEEIQKQNQVLDRPKQETKELTEQIKKGNKLVLKCSKLHRWNCFKRTRYTNKLLELDDNIHRYFKINVPAYQWRITNDMSIKLDKCLSVSQTRLDTPCAVPELRAIVVGLDKPVKELKMELFKDEVSVLVLTAPGGCGKTTLAQKVCQDLQVQEKFKDNIFFVTVAKKPNLEGIIKKLFEHKRTQVPEFYSNDDAVNLLEQLLKKIAPHPILLVLDDVWSESIIDKFVFQIPNYKILVTSRCVFRRWTLYPLRSLEDEDAMTLFRRSAFRQDGSSYIPDENLVKEIVKSCKGFPLVLKVIGRSLCGQPAAMWHNRVTEWSKGLSIFDTDSGNGLLDCLGTSLELDALNNKVLIKECFMDLGSFPEDQRIPATVLIDIWVELHKLEEDGRGAIVNLHELSDRNLANLVVTRSDALCHANEVDGCYNEHFVTQHDVLRELAIYQSSLEPIEQRKRLIMDISENNLPKWWTEQKQQPVYARLLSISTDETFSSTWCDMQLPEVEVLVLNFQTKNYTLPKFMEKMDKLKVLVVTNYGFFPTELSNFPLLGSLSSLKRIRLEKISIPPLGDTTIQLENLQKISLVMCNISRALRNCTINIADMLPNLLEINIECCNDLAELPVELCDILHLKKLSITNCHKLSLLPEEIRKLENLEMLRLSSCSGLLDLQDSIRNLHKLQILDISDCVSIMKLPEQIGELHNLEKFYMSGRLKLSELPPSIMDLEHLKHVICDEQRARLWRPLKRRLSNLRIEVLKEEFNLNWL